MAAVHNVGHEAVVLMTGPVKMERIAAFQRKTHLLLKDSASAFVLRSIEEYQIGGSLHKLLISIGRILDRPKKLALLRDIREFVMQGHLPAYDEEIFIWQETGVPPGTSSYNSDHFLDTQVPGSCDGPIFSSISEMCSPQGLMVVVLKRKKKTELGFTVASSSRHTTVIDTVSPNSEAHLAGLRVGDRVVAVNDTRVTGLGFRDVTTTLATATKEKHIKLIIRAGDGGANKTGKSFRHDRAAGHGTRDAETRNRTSTRGHGGKENDYITAEHNHKAYGGQSVEHHQRDHFVNAARDNGTRHQYCAPQESYRRAATHSNHVHRPHVFQTQNATHTNRRTTSLGHSTGNYAAPHRPHLAPTHCSVQHLSSTTTTAPQSRQRPGGEGPSTTVGTGADHVVQLHIPPRHARQPLGLRIRGGVPEAHDIAITEVDAQSVAEDAGVRPGMRILAVNGIDFRGITHQRAVAVMQGTGPLQLTVMTRHRGGQQQQQQQLQHQHQHQYQQQHQRVIPATTHGTASYRHQEPYRNADATNVPQQHPHREQHAEHRPQHQHQATRDARAPKRPTTSEPRPLTRDQTTARENNIPIRENNATLRVNPIPPVQKSKKMGLTHNKLSEMLGNARVIPRAGKSKSTQHDTALSTVRHGAPPHHLSNAPRARVATQVVHARDQRPRNTAADHPRHAEAAHSHPTLRRHNAPVEPQATDDDEAPAAAASEAEFANLLKHVRGDWRTSGRDSGWIQRPELMRTVDVTRQMAMKASAAPVHDGFDSPIAIDLFERRERREAHSPPATPPPVLGTLGNSMGSFSDGPAVYSARACETAKPALAQPRTPPPGVTRGSNKHDARKGHKAQQRPGSYHPFGHGTSSTGHVVLATPTRPDDAPALLRAPRAVLAHAGCDLVLAALDDESGTCQDGTDGEGDAHPPVPDNNYLDIGTETDFFGFGDEDIDEELDTTQGANARTTASTGGDARQNHAGQPPPLPPPPPPPLPTTVTNATHPRPHATAAGHNGIESGRSRDNKHAPRLTSKLQQSITATCVPSHLRAIQNFDRTNLAHQSPKKPSSTADNLCSEITSFQRSELTSAGHARCGTAMGKSTGPHDLNAALVVALRRRFRVCNASNPNDSVASLDKSSSWN